VIYISSDVKVDIRNGYTQYCGSMTVGM